MTHARRGSSLLALAILSVGTLACGSGTPEPPPKPVSIGEPLVFDCWTVTIHDVSMRGSVGGKLMRHVPSDGAELRVVELTVENTGKRATSLAGAVFFADAEDRQYAPVPECMFALGAQGLVGLEQIQPGLKKKGKVCYEVPEGARLTLMVRPALLQQPVEVRPY